MLKPYEDKKVIALCCHIANSFNELVERPLVEALSLNPKVLAKQIYEAESVIVAHIFEDILRFRFANAAAQSTFGYDWDEFQGMDSQETAEPILREERERLLKRAEQDGYVDDYQGVRITKDGHRFEIKNVVLCSIFDERKNMIGQTAVFKDICFLDKEIIPSGHSRDLSCGS